MHIVWWYWICFGIFLLLSEIMTPGGFYLLFIGVAAIVTGASALAISTAWIQIIIFAILSTFFIVFLRKYLVERVRKTTLKADSVEFVGETAKAVENIEAGKEGRIELRGTSWMGRNVGKTDLTIGSACVVESRDGIILVVKQKI